MNLCSSSLLYAIWYYDTRAVCAEGSEGIYSGGYIFCELQDYLACRRFTFTSH